MPSSQSRAPRSHYFKGEENLDILVPSILGTSGSTFRLVFVRVHFRDGVNTDLADFTITLHSSGGDEYDALLYTYRNRGQGADVNLILNAADLQQPSGWSFVAGDQLHFEWTNPNPKTLKWGLEVGITTS